MVWVAVLVRSSIRLHILLVLEHTLLVLVLVVLQWLHEFKVMMEETLLLGHLLLEAVVVVE